jgi:hypothetical protein
MKIPRRPSALVTPLVLGVACVALAACGSSSSATSTSANASATTTSGSATGGGAGASRFAALRACLQKQGVTLPQRPAGAPRTPGAGGAGGGGFFGGGGGAAGGSGGAFSGANATKLRAALQKCGGGSFGQRRRSVASNPAAVTALTKFAACMRSNGINVPAPNTSGTGPVFNTSGLNTTSTAFKTAYAKCASDLPTGFGRRGTSGASGAAGGSA